MLQRFTLMGSLTAIMLVFSIHCAFAHKPLLAVEDNKDGTMYIEAAFSDGSSAAGHKIVIKDDATGKVLSEHRVGEDGTLELPVPKVKHTVTLDAGEGHKLTVEGPAPTSAEAVKVEPKEEGKPPAVQPKPAVEAPSGEETAPKGAPAPTAVPAPAAPATYAASTAVMSPGMVRAFEMMMITQIVTAVALIVIVSIVAYYVGYTMGRNSGVSRRGKEV
ncbi:MAG: hypothetical protein RDU20_03450 [Desulfomonilaceae bacterium]|nr:hypothetical protein [Desulfomonilaceae bacterium]